MDHEQAPSAEDYSSPAVVRPNWGRQAGAGRTKGTPNKLTTEVREAARAIVDDPAYRESLIKRLHAGLAPHMETLLWHYAYGKPKETIEVEGNVTVEKIVREVINVTPEPLQLDAIH